MLRNLTKIKQLVSGRVKEQILAVTFALGPVSRLNDYDILSLGTGLWNKGVFPVDFSEIRRET